ncbi:MAG: hypothetical protein IKV01_01275 [Clostridia bacterium]|nr:hypothetical protein [Clostridia bacterium]
MIKEQIMSAIGNINDEFITECCTKNLYKRRKLRIYLWASACAVLAIISIGFTANILSKQNNVIWNENPNIQEIEECYRHASIGKVVIADSLQNAVIVLTPSEQNKPSVADDECVFAVLVTETTGASKEEIYRDFILPLGAEEEYLDSGIIFLTREQLKEIKCPNNFAIILSLAAKQ